MSRSPSITIRFPKPTFADAILDRIVHNAHRIDLVGPSMRKAIAENINANAIDHTEQK